MNELQILAVKASYPKEYEKLRVAQIAFVANNRDQDWIGCESTFVSYLGHELANELRAYLLEQAQNARTTNPSS